MRISRTTNHNAASFRSLHKNLLAAASADPLLVQVINAALDPTPFDAMNYKIRQIAEEILIATPVQRDVDLPDHSDYRDSENPLVPWCPDHLQLTIYLSVKHSPEHSDCVASITSAQLCANGEVLQKSPPRCFEPMSLPPNGPTSWRFRDQMIERGWTPALVLYRAVASLPNYFRWWHQFPFGAHTLDWQLDKHKERLRQFSRCVPLLQCLDAGDVAGAFTQAHVCLGQLLGFRVADPRELVRAAKTKRDNAEAEFFSHRISLPEPARFGLGSAFGQLLSGGNVNDLDFRALFALMIVADASAWAFDSTLTPMTVPAATSSAPAPDTASGSIPSVPSPGHSRRKPALGRGLRPLLGVNLEETSNPRTRVLNRLESIQRSEHDEWTSILDRCRNLLIVLESGNTHKLHQLLRDHHEGSLHAIGEAAVDLRSLIDDAKRGLDQLDRVTSDCMNAINERTAGMSHAQQVLKARAEFARSRRRISTTYEASGANLKEHLRVLERAQTGHVSRELDALIEFIEARADVERAVELNRVMVSVQRMRDVADEAMRMTLEEWRSRLPYI